VVAVIRGDQAYPAPDPQFTIHASDTLVVVGTSEGIAEVDDILSDG
jgi:TrkA domain protein